MSVLLLGIAFCFVFLIDYVLLMRDWFSGVWNNVTIKLFIIQYLDVSLREYITVFLKNLSFYDLAIENQSIEERNLILRDKKYMMWEFEISFASFALIVV
jgi:hypothetical protein